jgi:hypothetical protein
MLRRLMSGSKRRCTALAIHAATKSAAISERVLGKAPMAAVHKEASCVSATRTIAY